MKRCFIYAAGTFYGLREPPREGDLQIAAAAGLHLCERLGVRPDVVLGDFDSDDYVATREWAVAGDGTLAHGLTRRESTSSFVQEPGQSFGQLSWLDHAHAAW